MIYMNTANSIHIYCFYQPGNILTAKNRRRIYFFFTTFTVSLRILKSPR